MVRRLRFECQMESDESVVGAFFRSASRHVFPSVFPVLKQAGISRKSIRFIQILPREQILRLADVIRCDPNMLGRDLGVRQGNASPDERGRQLIAFGDLVIEGCHLDHKRRRISSSSLKSSLHHRVDWLNRLLPYCPSALDLLIDTCPNCSGTLGWTQPVGMEHCEHCEYDLRDAKTVVLDPTLVEDYRNFAELCSVNNDRRREMIKRLPPMLSAVAPGTLVRFALHTGKLVSGMVRVPETHLTQLPPAELTGVLASGMRVLVDWPNRLQDWISNEARAREEDKIQYAALKSDLIKMARRFKKEPDGGKLVEVIFPDLANDVLRSHGARLGTHAVLREHYSANETTKRLRTDSSTVTKLRELVKCTTLRCKDSVVRRYLFEADIIDQIAADLENCVYYWQFWKTFRIPSYGVEQLICLNLLQGITSPAILLLKKEVVLSREELDRLTKLIKRNGRNTPPPATATSLRVLANSIGGQLKPWGPIYELLISGKLPFWLKPGGVSTHHILLDPQDWFALDPLSFDYTLFPHFPFKTAMNNCDMSEVVNLQPRESRKVREADLQNTKRYKLAIRYQVDEVLGFAQNWVSVTELMRRSGKGDRSIKKELTRASVPSKAGLWERSTAEALIITDEISRRSHPPSAR